MIQNFEDLESLGTGPADRVATSVSDPPGRFDRYNILV